MSCLLRKFKIIIVLMIVLPSLGITNVSNEKKIEILSLLLQQDNIGKYSKYRYEEDLSFLNFQKLESNFKNQKESIQGGFGTASFSGTIRDASSNPIFDHSVYLEKYVLGEIVASESFNTTTDISGNFSFNNLAAGDYAIRVGTIFDDYIDFVYRETIDGGPLVCSSCTYPNEVFIAIVDAEVRNNIDFTIPLGGVINGVLEDATTHDAITSQSLRIIQVTGIGNYRIQALLDGLGGYSIKGIPDGSYKIYSEIKSFSVANYHIPQIFDGGECNYCYRLYEDGAGTLLTISSANTINNVDFLLNTGASISGRLVDVVTLSPLSIYNWVYVVDENNVPVGSLVFEGTSTQPSETGDYTIGGLLPGSYYVQGGDLGREYYMREIFANKPCYWSGCDRAATGDSVVLAANENRIGVNFLLEKGGKISGTITDSATGVFIPPEMINAYYGYLQIYDSSNNVVGGGYILNETINGDYTSARAIPAGIYSIKTGNMFLGNSFAPYIDEKYNDVPCSGLTCDLTTVNITVTTEATTSGIDFALSLGYSFSGTITDTATGDPIPSVHVLVYKDMGVGMEPKFANWATTSDGTDGSLVGSFEVSGLSMGTYYAVTNNGSRLPFLGVRTVPGAGWIDVLYNNMPCPAVGCDISTGTPIILPTVIRGGAALAVDFNLTQGASISGKVKNFNDNALIDGVFVNVFDDQGISLGSYQSDTNGNYHTAGFPAGTYYLTTSSHDALVDVKFGNAYCFENSCDPLNATPLVLTTQESAVNKDFILKTDYVFRSNFD